MARCRLPLPQHVGGLVFCRQTGGDNPCLITDAWIDVPRREVWYRLLTARGDVVEGAGLDCFTHHLLTQEGSAGRG